MTSSQSQNPYVYCMNNPLRYIDPSGMRASERYTDSNGETHWYGTVYNSRTGTTSYMASGARFSVNSSFFEGASSSTYSESTQSYDIRKEDSLQERFTFTYSISMQGNTFTIETHWEVWVPYPSDGGTYYPVITIGGVKFEIYGDRTKVYYGSKPESRIASSITTIGINRLGADISGEGTIFKGTSVMTVNKSEIEEYGVIELRGSYWTTTYWKEDFWDLPSTTHGGNVVYENITKHIRG